MTSLVGKNKWSGTVGVGVVVLFFCNVKKRWFMGKVDCGFMGERERERESGEGCVGVLCVLWLREWVGGSDPSLTILAFCSGRGGRVINAWNV